MTNDTMKKDLKKAYFGGGCFWCMEAAFEMIQGVKDVISGYMGGDMKNPTYEQVCGGGTGHAEIIEITYDSAVVSYRQLLEVFFTVHDPTQLNRQGNDIGTQYRSVIFVSTNEERKEAEQLISELESDQVFDTPIVTEVADMGPFYLAEAYHQDYYTKNPEQAYCQVVIAPKLAKLRERVSHLLVTE